MCPVPSPGGCSGLPPPGGDRTHNPGLPPPAGSVRSCSQPSSFAPGGAVSRLPHGAHLGCAPLRVAARPHVASPAGRGGPEVREPRATGREARAGAKALATSGGRGGGRLRGRRSPCAVVRGLRPAQRNPLSPPPPSSLARWPHHTLFPQKSSFGAQQTGQFPWQRPSTSLMWDVIFSGSLLLSGDPRPPTP